MKSPLTRFLRLVAVFLGTVCWLATGLQTSAASAASSAATPAADSPAAAVTTVAIPGPLRSFLRMAAISQKVSPDEVLPLLARNVVTEGYHGWQDSPGKPTEYLVLLNHYVDQARQLVALAGPSGVIHAANCEEAKPLLAVLGYRLKSNCGKDASVETADADRAFLTLDSGFPLALLEESLRSGKVFTSPYPTTQVPVLFTAADWAGATTSGKRDIVDVLLRDPALGRLYWALARMDAETSNSLRQSVGLRRLSRYAAVLDFYGSHLRVRAGRVAVPGGTAAEPGWKTLVGADPGSPTDFITNLVSKDEGWLAAYFDSLARVSQPQQAYFTQPAHLSKFYEALRGHNFYPGAARPVFRPDPGLLLLAYRLRFEAGGQPMVPGNLDAWKDVLRRKGGSAIVRDWSGRSVRWNNSDDLVEAMFGLSRLQEEDGPLQVFLALSEIDRGRSGEQRLSPQTVRLLADHFGRFGDQYPVFAEFNQLSNASIARFITVASSIDRIGDRTLRGNTIGMFQATLGLWQILARQGEIAGAEVNSSWQQAVQSFAGVRSASQLFDAGRGSMRALMQAGAGRGDLSQDDFVDLLASPNVAGADARKMRQEIAGRIRTVLQGQRLVSLDTLLAFGDGLSQLADGKTTADKLLPLATELRDFELPRPLFTGYERTQWSAGTTPENPHAALQARTDFVRILKSAHTAKEYAAARGQLAAFLRDTLVGLNYGYYEPPGAQMLHNNPLFVRSHDFSGLATSGGEASWQTPRLFGSGLAVGRGAHLAGSLAHLPYALSQVEQDFIVPENVQALIWDETVPALVTSAILPRWWRVPASELHAVALYQRAGEELLAAATGNDALRQKLIAILAQRMLPQAVDRVDAAIRAGHVDEARDVLPADALYLAAEYRRLYPTEHDTWGAAGHELAALAEQHPAEVSWERISHDFGVPHPALAQTYGRELLNSKPLPAMDGYGSRLLAESWDSSNLYWARLADELGYPPVMLNRLVPELTRRMVEKIFATDLEDWPALARAMREAGDEFRRSKTTAATTASTVEP